MKLTIIAATGGLGRQGLSVPRADVTHFMLSVLDQPQTIRQVIGIAS